MAAAMQQELAILSQSKMISPNPISIIKMRQMDHYNKSVTMKQDNPLQREVSRILHSDPSSELNSQLKHLNSYEARIEQELVVKSTQIAQLQNYLKEEITNIQKIVDENSRLKKELEGAKKLIDVKSSMLEDAAKEVQTLTQINRESAEIIKRLEEQVQDLEAENEAMMGKEKKESGTQTEARKEEASTTSTLLNKIASLEELVMQLKFQKNELQQRANMYGSSSSMGSAMQNDNDTSLDERKMTTSIVLAMIAEDELREVRFKGEIIEGQKQGKGTCEYQDGIVYQGQFHEGKRQGFGVIIVDDHILYRGCWKNNLIEGKGHINMLEGEIESYEGHFSQGRLEGYGCMKLKSGKRVTALWKDGKIVGNCIETAGQSKRYRKPELIECY